MPTNPLDPQTVTPERIAEIRRNFDVGDYDDSPRDIRDLLTALEAAQAEVARLRALEKIGQAISNAWEQDVSDDVFFDLMDTLQELAPPTAPSEDRS